MAKSLFRLFVCLYFVAFATFALAKESNVCSSNDDSLNIRSTKTACTCGGEATSEIDIVFYDEVKDLPNHPDVLLIDVREPEEIVQTGQIPTSINIPLGMVQKELGRDVDSESFKLKYLRDKPNKETKIIFYCRSGKRAQEAAECAASLGYENVKNYKGSWNEWAKREGLPL